EWVKRDVGKVYVSQFDAALANWVGEPAGICVFSKNCGDAVVIEHNGDVYSCDHYVYPEYKLGNIRERTLFGLVQSEKQQEFGQNKSTGLPRQCIECKYRFACHGECPKHRFLKTTDGEPGLNYLCSGYKKFFGYVEPYMQFMGRELKANRPPANVMNWARQFAN
ncbi:MAG: SPASM domain-containing protein, partial [Mariniphaga sp.]